MEEKLQGENAVFDAETRFFAWAEEFLRFFS